MQLPDTNIRMENYERRKNRSMLKTLRLSLLLALVCAMLLCVACVEPKTVPAATVDVTDAPEPAIQQQVISIVTEPPVSDEQMAQMNEILKRATFLEGTTVNGVAIGGMTTDQAKSAIEPVLAEAKKNFSVTVTDGDDAFAFTGEQITLTDDLEDVLEEAFNLVREDKGYDAVMAEVEAIRTAGKPFEVKLTFDDAALKNALISYGEAHNVAPVDASVSYNQDEHKLQYTDDVPGKTVDTEAMAQALKASRSGETIEAIFTETPAEVTRENVQEKFVLRGKMTTNYSKSIKNRKYNIFHGASLISGTVLHPGEVFSANGTLGVRNKANGWKVATAYVAGAHEKQYGGGVCQLSSTLYNAAVMADMKIVERRNHSMPVDYVSKGLDATINSIGNIIDFKFENSSKSDIIIVAYVDNPDYAKAGNLTMEIWGIPILEDSDGKYDEIRIPSPKKLKTLNPSGDVEYRVDESKKPGYKEQIVRNQKGSVWQSYVEYYLNGELVERKDLDQSTYKAFAAVYIVGPDKEAEESPKVDPAADPTEQPSVTPDPTEKPADPTEKPADPTEKPADPTEKPADPTEKPAEKPAETEKPSGDSGEGNGD